MNTLLAAVHLATLTDTDMSETIIDGPNGILYDSEATYP